MRHVIPTLLLTTLATSASAQWWAQSPADCYRAHPNDRYAYQRCVDDLQYRQQREEADYRRQRDQQNYWRDYQRDFQDSYNRIVNPPG